MKQYIFVLVVLLGAAVAVSDSALGCSSCEHAVGALSRTAEEMPASLARTLKSDGRSVCSHAGFHRAACNAILAVHGEDVLYQAIIDKDSSQACSFACDSGADFLWSLDGGGVRRDKEDEANKQKQEAEKAAVTDSPIQTKKEVEESAEDRRRREVAAAKAETDQKVAEAVKKVTDRVEENTRAAVAAATAKAVAEAKEAWKNEWRHREWPVNVKVPDAASKLNCTDKSLGRIAFRNNNFYGCKTHCVQNCKQCNCRQEQKVVEDPDCKCFKEVKKEVCDQCCTDVCGPEWQNFGDCSRQCKDCDCKEEHGIKVCQSCCKEVCSPKWNPDPI